MVYCGLNVAMVSSYLYVSDEKGQKLMSSCCGRSQPAVVKAICGQCC
jgi:hypothetical protein